MGSEKTDFLGQGIFAGYVATYITRDDWRKQIFSAAIPALALLIMSCAACESQRWLIIKGKIFPVVTPVLAACITILQLHKSHLRQQNEVETEYDFRKEPESF